MSTKIDDALLLDVRLAELTPEAMAAIEALERELGDGVHLLAVRALRFDYVLEVKLAANRWVPFEEAYPDLEQIVTRHPDEVAARAAKARAKDLFRSPRLARLKKRPIRIRRVAVSEA